MATQDTETTVNQPTPAPTTKVAAGGIAGSVTIILVWLIGFTGVEVPAEVASAFTAIISFATAYMVPERVQGVEG